MRLSTGRKAAVLLASLILLTFATNGVATAPTQLPKPVLLYVGPEFYEANGKQWTRYKYTVVNRADYPNELFAPAPGLPPCGQNTKASRTWVDVYQQDGKRLYGFCSLANHNGLAQLWFAIERNAIPPSWVYIELTDRQTGTKYKSNLAETVE